MTFLIRRSTCNNSINFITVLYSQRVIVMEQLIPFKEWGGFALKFGSLISFFIGAYFTELRFYSDFDIWASKGRDVQINSRLHTYYDYDVVFLNIFWLEALNC